MNAWWSGLSDRERWLVGGGGAAAVALLIYLLVWEPFRDGLADRRQTVAALRADLAWMQQAAAELKRLQADPGGPARPAGQRPSLLILVDQSARAAGLGEAVKRVEPQGADKIRIQLEDAGFDALIRWLGALEREHGVFTDNAAISPKSTAGRVDARLILGEPR